MQATEYPFIYWKPEDGYYVGNVLGYSFTYCSDSLSTLKFNLSAMMSNYYDLEQPLRNVKTKIYRIKIHPSYKLSDKIFPVAKSSIVQVSAIFGQNYTGSFECFLPQFQLQFTYFKPQELGFLVEHHVIGIVKESNPEWIYRCLMQPVPVLDNLQVKSDNVKSNNYNTDDSARFPITSGVSQQYPLKRAVIRNLKTFPDFTWGNELIVNSMIDKLLSFNSNVLIVGNKGVGKSSVILDAIKKVSQESKKNNNEIFFWKTEPSRMISGAKYFGEWQGICERIVEELAENNGVLWVNNFMEMFSVGGSGAEDSLAAYLTRFLQNGTLHIISELTENELEAARKLLPGFISAFHIVKISEPDNSQIQIIFKNFSAYIKREYAIDFNEQTFKVMHQLLNKYIKYESNPGKISNFLASCLNKSLMNKKNSIEISDFYSVFIEKTGIAELFLNNNILLNNNELNDFFQYRIKGQPHVIHEITNIIKILKAGLNDPAKPVATLLFAGPSGVGKTATAKALAEFIFSNNQQAIPLIRLDMSEFQHPSQISRLIGSGFQNTGKLVKEIKQQPFSVVLLDEIEKAHSSVFDAILTMLDEGIIMDSFGRIVDFRNSVIILTSNIGSTGKSALGFKPNNQKNYMHDLRHFFKPEFLNRIDYCLVFNSLNEDSIFEITKKELETIQHREGLKKRNINLLFTDSLIQFIAKIGFDEQFGARPLQREIEKQIIVPLANFIVNEKVTGNCEIQITFTENKIQFITQK